MQWTKARRSKNVNDTREGKDARMLTGTTLAAGMAAVALASAGLYSTLDTPTDVTPIAPSYTLNRPLPHPSVEPQEDLQLMFVQSVLGDTEDTWQQLFSQMGRHYPQPTLTLFDNGVVSGCGFASSSSGPFYCPSNQQVYLDLEFFSKLEQQFAVVGDFARAYIIAHEIGHHVQLELGLSESFEKALLERQAVSGDGGLLVRQELQADCLAGVWAYNAQKRLNWLEPGDIEEALNAANAIGDDRLQQQGQGRVVPDSFTHGTSAQRVRWFKTGFAQGQVGQCDTFAAKNL